MAIIQCNIKHMRNQDFMRNGKRYHLDENCVCNNISDEDAKVLSSFKDGSWTIIEIPVVIEKKIIEAPLAKEAVIENKDKPSIQELIDNVLSKKKNKKNKGDI